MPPSRRCSQSLYRVLDVKTDASKSEIKKAYHKLALTHHPDKAGPGHEAEFKQIQEAHSILIDEEQRSLYDKFGRAGMKSYAEMPGSSVVAVHPGLIMLYPAILLLFACCFIAFLALLAKKVDYGLGSWNAVFAPLFVLETGAGIIGLLALSLVPRLCTAKPDAGEEHDAAGVTKRNRLAALNLLLVVADIAAFIASTALSLQTLDNTPTSYSSGSVGQSWGKPFAAIFAVLGITTILRLLTLDFDMFKRAQASEAGVPVEAIDSNVIRPQYIGHVAGTILRVVCDLAFTFLLYENVVGTANRSFIAVFAPLFVEVGLPVAMAVLKICCGSEGGLGIKAKCGMVIITLLLSSLSIISVALLAVKCENARKGLGPEAYPHLSTVFIPSYIVLSIILLGGLVFTCMACGQVRELSGDGGDGDGEYSQMS